MIVKSLPCTAGTIIIKVGAKHFFFSFFFCGLEKERKRLKMSGCRPRLYFDEENASYSLHSSHRESSYDLHSSHTEIGMEKVAIVYTVRTEKVAVVYTVRTQR